MKTKYKILITSILVLSLLTAFAVTSFATYTTTDITFNDAEYTFNKLIDSTSIVISDYEDFYYTINSSTSLDNLPHISAEDHPELTLTLEYGSSSVTIYIYDGSTRLSSTGFSSLFSIYINGDYQISNSSVVVNDIATATEYDVFQSVSNNRVQQVNIVNINDPNPLQKVNDFLGYLSTSLNKLTTMIITNQILILFIVAVPVVSFVIGSFKRIKDAGRA